MTTPPATWDDVLSIIGFNESARAVITDEEKLNIRVHMMHKWDYVKVDNLVKTLQKTPDPKAKGKFCYVSPEAIDNLKTFVYIRRHLARTQRPVEISMFTLDFITDWEEQRKMEEEYEDPKTVPKLLKSDTSSILLFIDKFPEKLKRFTGRDGRPLSYVIRDQVEPPAPSDDPLFNQEGSRYKKVRDEVAARSPIGRRGGPAYEEDNGKVLQILREALDAHESVSLWTNAFVADDDGRGAWMAFKAHFLGTSQLANVTAEAHRVINTTVYTGEKARYSFEAHVSTFKKAHLDLKKTRNEPDEDTKVRAFAQSIKAPELQMSLHVVLGVHPYKSNFDEAVNYIRQFVVPLSQSTRTVAAVGAKTPSTPPAGLTYRWYKKDEFRALPKEHQDWLRAEKRRRGQGKGEKKNLTAALQRAKRKIAMLEASSDSDKKAKRAKDKGKDIDSDEE